jgi:putative membrane protein
MTARNLYPGVLAAIFVVVFAWLAIAPLSRTVWIAEVIPVVIVFAALALSFPAFRFSNTAYSLMAVWLFWHTVGGHYTFANVPFGWVSELLGTERNHFDRIGHFSVGLYAFPMMEWLLRRRHCGTVTAGFFAVFFIMSIAAAYEIVEWWFAVVAGGDAGVEFLGAQGDIWDAQKDMLADTLGAILAVVLYLVLRPDQSRR